MNLPGIGIVKVAVVKINIIIFVLVLLEKFFIDRGQIIVISLLPKKSIFQKCWIRFIFEVLILSVPSDKIVLFL